MKRLCFVSYLRIRQRLGKQFHQVLLREERHVGVEGEEAVAVAECRVVAGNVKVIQEAAEPGDVRHEHWNGQVGEIQHLSLATASLRQYFGRFIIRLSLHYCEDHYHHHSFITVLINFIIVFIIIFIITSSLLLSIIIIATSLSS